MSIKDRLRTLENAIAPKDPFRVVFIPNGADPLAARERYRKETGYSGVVVVMDEADGEL